jgi:hypothetical protein
MSVSSEVALGEIGRCFKANKWTEKASREQKP